MANGCRHDAQDDMFGNLGGRGHRWVTRSSGTALIFLYQRGSDSGDSGINIKKEEKNMRFMIHKILSGGKKKEDFGARQ